MSGYGLISNMKRTFCANDYVCSDPKAPRAYGTWLRAPNRKSVSVLGAHRLLDGRDHVCTGDENGGSNEEIPSMESLDINANGKAICFEDNASDLGKE